MPKFTDIFNILNIPQADDTEETRAFKAKYTEYNQVGKLIDKTTGTIPDNQWANVMRCSMENKNLLAKKGTLYIGTGETVELAVPGEDGTQKVSTTDVLLPGDEDSFLTVGPMDSSSQGLKYRKLVEQDIPNISYDKIKEDKIPNTKIGNIPFTQITNFPAMTVSVEATDTDWQVSSETNAPGKYYKSITLSGDFNGKSPMVQLMLQQGSSFTIVNSTIKVNGITVIVYSNIQFKGKILIIGI